MTPEAKAAKAAARKAKAEAKKAAKLALKGNQSGQPSLQDTTHVPASDITIVVPEQEQKPKTLNKVVFRLYQDFVKIVNKTIDGVKVAVEKPVKHHWEVSFETDKPITSQALAVWITARLTDYQVMQQYQGRARFDTTAAIEFDMSVNDRGADMGLKFSTNAKALERIFNEKCPALMARVFGAQTYDAYDHTKAGMQRIKNETLAFVQGQQNLLLAKGVESQAEANLNTAKEIVSDPIKNAVDPTVDIPLNK